MKILFPIISLFLAYDAQRWFFTLLSMEPDQISFGVSFFIAFMLNIDLLGIFAIPGFVFSLFKILPRSFYSTSDSLTDSVRTFYRVFGVEYFRMLISFLFWKRGSNRTSFFDGTKEGLSEMLTSSQRAEFGHWMGLILV